MTSFLLCFCGFAKIKENKQKQIVILCLYHMQYLFSKLQNQTLKPKLFWTNKLKCYLILQFNKINFEEIKTLVLFWFSLFFSPLLNSGKRKQQTEKKTETGPSPAARLWTSPATATSLFIAVSEPESELLESSFSQSVDLLLSLPNSSSVKIRSPPQLAPVPCHPDRSRDRVPDPTRYTHLFSPFSSH